MTRNNLIPAAAGALRPLRAAILDGVEASPGRVVFWLTLMLYLAFWNPLYFTPMTQLNLDLAWSLGQRGTVELFGDHVTDHVLVDGRVMSGVSPGAAFLAAPVTFFAGFLSGLESHRRLVALHMLVSLLVAIPLAAGTAAGMVRLVRLRGGTPLMAATTALLFALATNQFAVALSYSKELISTAMVVAALLCLMRPAGSPRAALTAGLCAGTLPLLQYSDAMVMAGLAVYGWWKGGWRTLVWFGLGALPALAVLGVYHAAAFGSPWLTAYDFPHAPFEFYGRLNSPREVAFIPFSPVRLGQILVGPHGFFMGNPLAVLGVVGLAGLVRRDGRRAPEAILGLSVLAVYAVAYTCYRYDGLNGPFLGWRFLHVLLPLLMLGLPQALAIVSRRVALAVASYGAILAYLVAQAGYLVVAQHPWDKYLYMVKIWLTSLGGGVFFADLLPRVLHVRTLHHGFRELARVAASGTMGDVVSALAPLAATQLLFAVVPLTLWGMAVAVTGLLLRLSCRPETDTQAEDVQGHLVGAEKRR